MTKRQERDLSRQAQEMMYDAWEMRYKADRVAYAKQALRVYPHCARALTLLANESKSTDDRLDLSQKAVEAARIEMGLWLPKSSDGIHWWGELESRPYMEAVHGLSRAEWAAGLHIQAVKRCDELLQLNPNDDQRVRYHLLHFAVALRWIEKMEVITRWHMWDDGSATAVYPLALWQYLQHGPSAAADGAMRVAISSNRWIPFYLLGIHSQPRAIPSGFAQGSREEAVWYFREFGDIWRGRYPELGREPGKWRRRNDEPPVDCRVFEAGDEMNLELKKWVYSCLVDAGESNPPHA